MYNTLSIQPSTISITLNREENYISSSKGTIGLLERDL